MEAVATYRHKDGLEEVVIVLDEAAEAVNPLDCDREWFEFLTVRNSRYSWGTAQVDAEELKERCERADLVLPVYAYVHSAVAFSLGAFSCPWDSGQCGAIVLSRATFEKAIGRKLEEAAHEICKSLLDEYTDWVNGYVYGYSRNKITTCNLGHEHHEEVDSCWGFIGWDHIKSGLLWYAGCTVNGDGQELHPDWEEVG